jgi:hypothetical protein
MTGSSTVRMISRGVVRWTVRRGSGGHPTERWQDKSRSLRPGRPAADGRRISDFPRCALLHDRSDFRKSRATSMPGAPRGARTP